MKKICKLLLVAMIFFMAAPINVTVYASEIENDYLAEIRIAQTFYILSHRARVQLSPGRAFLKP